MVGDLLDALGEQDPLVVAVLLMILLAVEGSLLLGLFVPGDLAIVVAGTAPRRYCPAPAGVCRSPWRTSCQSCTP